jgi:protease-4
VATQRKSTPEAINEVAQGRVWTGAQAKQRNLVDSLGGLDMAIKNAAQRAALGEGYRVEYIEHAPRGLDRYLQMFFGGLAVALRDQFGWDGLARSLLASLPAPTPQELSLLKQAAQGPSRPLAFCFCSVR